MSLVAILATLRSRKRVNAAQPASLTLPSKLTVEARADGSWLLSRAGVPPSDKEVEVIARDAKLEAGYSVSGGPSKALDGRVYRLIVPANTLAIAPAIDAGDDRDPVEMAIDWEAVAAMARQRDRRPGTRLENIQCFALNTVFHFEAFGVTWTVLGKRERIGDAKQHDTIIYWASLEPLEGNQGMSEGTQGQWEDWFALHGSLSPLEPPERWQGEQ